jgi:hypothetical protein
MLSVRDFQLERRRQPAFSLFLYEGPIRSKRRFFELYFRNRVTAGKKSGD